MDFLQLDQPAEGVARITIHRPEVRNALNQAVREQLAEQFRRLGQDASVRAIVLTGGEKVFAAGADLTEFADKSAVQMQQRTVHLLWQAIAECPKPIVAAVNGYALGGGCELAMHACIDPLKSCTGVIVEGNDDEYPDGRRYQTLDGQA